jgi:uncharacterized membrane protein
MLLLLWWPIYRLLPHINTLFFLQSFTTSLAAWPVYLLARGKSVGRVTALLAGAGLLLFPPIARVPLAEIHNEAFPLAPLLLAFYFFEKKSLGGFTGFLALALLGKDTVVLSTVCFSLYALIRRRDWRWVAFPAVWSILYFVAIHRLAIPLWGDWWAQKLYGQTFFLRNWGRSPSEVALAMAQSPGRILQTAFSGDNLGYLARLLLPLGVVLPFGSWAWLTAIPGLAVNLLGACPYLRTFTHWYSTLVGAQLWASLVLALPYWNRRLAG